MAYEIPVPELVALVDAEREPGVLVSPEARHVALIGKGPLPSIEQVAQPQLRLAGIRFNPVLYLDTRFEFGASLDIVDPATRRSRRVTGLPEPVQIVEALWSPDANHLAVSVLENSAVHLWIVAAESGHARRALAEPLNAIVGRGFAWLGGSREMVIRLRADIPSTRVKAQKPRPGPTIQFTDGVDGPSQLPTFEDLLKTDEDEDLLERYLHTQIALIDVLNPAAAARPIGSPLPLLRLSAAPDGEHLLVARLTRPYSRRVPIDHFAHDLELWNRVGPLPEQVRPIAVFDLAPPGPDAVATGAREFSWRADVPATLVWVEAQDRGDPRVDVSTRDIVYQQAAPFTEAPRVLARLGRRFGGIDWGRADLAIVREWTWKTRDMALWMINPSRPEAALRLLFEWKSEDRYRDPGVPLTRTELNGASTLVLAGQRITLFGAGATPEGERPFVDQFDMDSAETRRLWQSAPPYFEQPLALFGASSNGLLTMRQSTDVPPNLILHEHFSDAGIALTEFADPTPSLRGVTRTVLRYRRSDGVELSANLYLPPGYQSEHDGPLPTLLWAYPQEFRSASAASQIKGSPHKFNAIGFWGPLPFVARGFAVLDNPTMPIVGEGTTEPNDSYVAQLTENARAAIDEVVRLGVTDRNRVAVGGHSYGAFMTANLLAHTRLFRAGIARSGAYNRTLTPFGFQAEDRNFWDAKDVYLAMSAFVHADRIVAPLLLMHGQVDNNTGTYPIQSERMYQAINGLGGAARLVLFPHESHHYKARESLLHMLWEEDRWLALHVRDASLFENP